MVKMARSFVSILFSFVVFHSLTSAMNIPPFARTGEDTPCLQRDAIYKPGERFADETCNGWCECISGGSVKCVSLCPPSPVPMCTPGFVLETQKKPSADPTGRCTCERETCVPRQPLPPPGGLLEHQDKCVLRGAIYKPEDRFADAACTGWCKCISGGRVGCVSLCPPSPVPMCSPGFVLETQKKPSADPTGRCTCERETCVPRQPLPPPGGLLEHHVVPECRNRVANDWFINKSCTGRCKCQLMGGIACVSLCPPMGVRCPPEEEMESYEHPMDSEGRCTCKRERCVAKIGAW